MRFGACCGTDKLPILKKHGYDYIELNFSDIALSDGARFGEICGEIEHYGLSAECYNGFFKPDIKLNDGADYAFIAEYAEKGFSRAERLGGKIAVLGSGVARKIPDGYSRDKAIEQFVRVLNICGEAAGKHGMKLAVEPLNVNETNFINTVADGMEICRLADNENVKCLVDFFHLYMNGEAADSVKNSNGMLIHAHIARPNPDRNAPTVADMSECTAWAAALRACGYDSRISLEGGFNPDFETAVREARRVLEVFA